MRSANAQRWIFGRIPRELSPSGKLGYQTLWATGEVSKDCAKELVRASSSFEVEHRSRYQFFHLSDGRVALTAARPSEDRRTVDRTGRRAFLLFAWILERRDFQAFGNHPFKVLPEVGDLPDTPALIRQLGDPGAAIEPVRIPCREIDGRRPAIPREALHTLIAAGYRAGRGAPVDRPIHLLGTAGECEAVLRWVHSYLPPVARIACTFSTQSDRVSIPAGRFWAAGRTLRGGQRSAFEVVLDRGAIRGDLSSQRNSPSAQRYRRWLEAAEGTEPPADEQLATVDLVLRSLAGEKSIGGAKPHSRRDLAELMKLYRDEIVDRVASRSLPFLPELDARETAGLQIDSGDSTAATTLLTILSSDPQRLDPVRLRLFLEDAWARMSRRRRWWCKLRLLLRRPACWLRLTIQSRSMAGRHQTELAERPATTDNEEGT